MTIFKNPLYILEAAKDIVSQEQKSTYEQQVNPKHALVNEEIKRIKEFIESSAMDKNCIDIDNFIEVCRNKKLADEAELSQIHSIGNLLELLLTKRRSFNCNLPVSTNASNQVMNSFSHELLLGNSQYTIQAICNEFSCSMDNVTPSFVENKKTQYCIKLTYLISKFDYCHSLMNSIEELNKKFYMRFSEEDIPKPNNIHTLDFSIVSKNAEKALDLDCPDFELNRILLGSLFKFKESIVHEIDTYCNKIDLANNFIASVQKFQQMDVHCTFGSNL